VASPSARWSKAALILATMSLIVMIQVPTATADPHPAHPNLVAETPEKFTPDVLNGHVSAFAQIGDLMIAAGQFSRVEQNGEIIKRKNIVAFSATTGLIKRKFHPYVDGEIFDLQVTPDEQHVVIVGNFGSVNHARHTSRIAEVSIASGAVSAEFRSPEPNNRIRDIAWANGMYYVSGDFTKMATHARRSVAALDEDGADTGIVHLNFKGTNNGGHTKVQSMDVSPDGTRMVVAGNFATINGLARGQLAVIDLTATTAKPSSWSTTRFTRPCGPHFDTYMRDVAIDPAGIFFVVVATGGPRGFQKSGLLCDSATRWELGSKANLQPTWIDYTGGDTLTAVIVDTNAVYIGGHMRWVNNSFGHNNARFGAVAREGIAALDPANGLPLSWDPGRRRGYGVFGFTLTTGGLWVGSDTTGFGGRLRARIAFCSTTKGAVIPPYSTGTLPGFVVTLGDGTTSTVTRRGFGGAQVWSPTTLSSTQNWQNVRGTFVVDDVLYSGWANGTMRAQPFDGTTLGPAVGVNLHRAFNDLNDVTSMFFDRESHRLYYTMIGSSQLYYRYFAPQSQIVGSWRYTVSAASQVNWARLQGSFLVGSRLFYVSSTDGSLSRVNWDASRGSTVGSPTLLLGPDDEVDLRSGGLVFTS
jgi:hypothetical protein